MDPAILTLVLMSKTSSTLARKQLKSVKLGPTVIYVFIFIN